MAALAFFCALGWAPSKASGTPTLIFADIPSPDLIIDFDSLPVGDIAAGTMVAPGVFTNDTVPGFFVPYGARVVDEGGGDHAIQFGDIGLSPVARPQTGFTLLFPQAVLAFSAAWEQISVGANSCGNAGVEVLTPAGDYVWAASQGTGSGPAGLLSLDEGLAAPAGAIQWASSCADSTRVWTIDDIRVQYVPEPGFDLGDVNGDGAVNGLDLAPFVDLVVAGTYQAEADCNFDLAVNGLDVECFTALVISGGEAAVVPEPTTVALAIVLLGLLCWRRAGP